MLISDVNHDEKNSIVEAEEKKVSSLRNCLKKASRKKLSTLTVSGNRGLISPYKGASSKSVKSLA
ncbi:MAG: hypothetical protein QW190_05760 [Thermoproteota archaeon]